MRALLKPFREDKWKLLLVVALVLQVSSLISLFSSWDRVLFFTLFISGGGLVIIYCLSLIFRNDEKRFSSGVDISFTKKVLLTIIVVVLAMNIHEGNWVMSVAMILTGISVLFWRKE